MVSIFFADLPRFSTFFGVGFCYNGLVARKAVVLVWAELHPSFLLFAFNEGFEVVAHDETLLFLESRRDKPSFTHRSTVLRSTPSRVPTSVGEYADFSRNFTNVIFHGLVGLESSKESCPLEGLGRGR